MFSRVTFERYVEQVCREIDASQQIADALDVRLDRRVDSIYLGGGTPSLLAPEQLVRIFRAVRACFHIEDHAEITVECAPGTITPEILAALLNCGVNRVSLGVQSFVDKEASSVGRLHTRAIALDDIARLRASGIGNISIDLIAGLPHQTPESWEFSLAETLATGVPHVSVYMLEVDEDSRLGHELLAGGSRYHAHFVPDEDLTADLYLAACERLERGGVVQYEISNFARMVPLEARNSDHSASNRGCERQQPGKEILPASRREAAACFSELGGQSRHNRKYWQRQPYLGFGVDAHSMLLSRDDLQRQAIEAVRFAMPDSLEGYSAAAQELQPVASRIRQLQNSSTPIDAQAALEEKFFLGLRLNEGIALEELIRTADRRMPGIAEALTQAEMTVSELVADGLLEKAGERVRLTPRGRLLSNEVFARFLSGRPEPEPAPGARG